MTMQTLVSYEYLKDYFPYPESASKLTDLLPKPEEDLSRIRARNALKGKLTLGRLRSRDLTDAPRPALPLHSTVLLDVHEDFGGVREAATSKSGSSSSGTGVSI